jgi:hypothetical protein
MPTKNIHEVIGSRLKAVDHDLDRLETLTAEAQRRGLNTDRLYEMSTAPADYAAQLRLIQRIEDPRNADDWRECAEGKALERLRSEQATELALTPHGQERTMLYTTLAKILKNNPCGRERKTRVELYGWLKLLNYLGKSAVDDEPLSIQTILESNGLDNALWALRCVDGHERAELRLLACDYAEHVLPLYESAHPGDKSLRECIQAARRYAMDQATLSELYAARSAIRYTNVGEARPEVMSAVTYAVHDVTLPATAYTAYATAYAARVAIGDSAGRTARDAEEAWQRERLCQMLAETGEDVE